MPLLPTEYVPWFRMSIDDMTPREYWQTAQEDIEIVSLVHEARHKGEARADREEREAREQKANAEKQKAEAGKRLDGLRARAGQG